MLRFADRQFRSSALGLCALVCVLIGVSQAAQARDCSSLIEAAEASISEAKGYDRQGNSLRDSVMSGDRFREPGNSYNCMNLGRVYRDIQSAMNAYNDAYVKLDNAFSVCPVQGAEALKRLMRNVEQVSGARRQTLQSLTAIGRSNGCRSLY